MRVRLLDGWVDVREEEGRDGRELEASVRLFDIGTPDVTHDARKSVLGTRKEIVSGIEFDSSHLPSLMLASMIVEHCVDTAGEPRWRWPSPPLRLLRSTCSLRITSFLALWMMPTMTEMKRTRRMT